jgi:nitrogenase-associated protein
MAHVLFFEKPGCANNTRQKAWLQAAGHEVEARSLLTHAWTRQELLSYFGDRPVAQWINRAAPRVKSGEIVPERLEADAALGLMLTDPLFIRRPLMLADGRREVGFDVATVHGWLGLPEHVVSEQARGAEACIKPAHGSECSEPKAR